MRAQYLFLSMLLALVAFARPSAQQKFQALGPNQCLNCHDHEAERQWYEKKEIPEVQKLFPEKGANAGHINSLKQLEATKSNDFAKAIGLADKYDVNGACVSCHATVFSGDANAGVSCESCHGPASGYLKPHQAKGAYDQSVAQFGMTKLVGNLQGWTQQCTNCHVMNDERLIKANHPSGDDFELGKKYVPVSLHFKKMYAQADIAAIGRSEMEGILRRRRGGAAPVAPVAAPPEVPPVAAAPVAAAAPAVAEPAPVAAPPPPASAAAPPAAAPRVAVARPAAPRPAVASAPPPGSPTSIEPPSAPEVVPPPAAAAPPPVTSFPPPAPAVTVLPTGSSGGPGTIWLLLGAAVLVVGGGALLWWRGKKPRR